MQLDHIDPFDDPEILQGLDHAVDRSRSDRSVFGLYDAANVLTGCSVIFRNYICHDLSLFGNSESSFSQNADYLLFTHMSPFNPQQ